MCVRYTLHKSDAALAAIAQALARKLAPPEWAELRYNGTLTHTMPAAQLAVRRTVRGTTTQLSPSALPNAPLLQTDSESDVTGLMRDFTAWFAATA